MIRSFNKFPRLVAIAAVGACGLMSAATPAHASSGRFSFSIQVGNPGFVGCRPVCAPCPSPEQIEFQRGLDTGAESGSREGYRDGLLGKCFNNCPSVDLCHVSRPFERGFRSGFTGAYASGFERGRCQRAAELSHQHARHWRRW